MCLAIPGKILEIITETPFRMATVDFLGVIRSVCLNTVNASIGDYVLVHAGVAISMLNADDAICTIDDLNKMTDYSEKKYGNDNRS